MKETFASALLLAAGLLAFGGAPRTQGAAGAHLAASKDAPPPFLAGHTHWADSVLSTLTIDERIAQLMMVAAYSNRDAKHEAEIEQLVRQRGIGGLIFFQGGPTRQARLTNRYQAAAKVPLLLGMDLEWGLAMRLDSTLRFPRQMALGAIQDDDLVRQMG
ncbi:MAG: glycoside hydrolase family 3 N-terminal domain-containing protein, partial [Flavobacteriales bacterium]